MQQSPPKARTVSGVIGNEENTLGRVVKSKEMRREIEHNEDSKIQMDFATDEATQKQPPIQKSIQESSPKVNTVSEVIEDENQMNGSEKEGRRRPQRGDRRRRCQQARLVGVQAMRHCHR